MAPNPLVTWRRLAAQGGLTAAGAEEEVVPASGHRTLRIRETHRLLGEKTLEAEILKKAMVRKASWRGTGQASRV